MDFMYHHNTKLRLSEEENSSLNSFRKYLWLQHTITLTKSPVCSDHHAICHSKASVDVLHQLIWSLKAWGFMNCKVYL